jgi:hypothetical protein
MFGAGQAQNGVLIEPETPIDIEDSAAVKKFLDAISLVICFFISCALFWLTFYWERPMFFRPTIERVNAYAPTHSRLFKDFIIVIDPQKQPFPRTAKGTIPRNRCLRMFDDRIRELYDRVTKDPTAGFDALDDAPVLKQVDETAVKNYVRDSVTRVMRPTGGEVESDKDLFVQGCDRYARRVTPSP